MKAMSEGYAGLLVAKGEAVAILYTMKIDVCMGLRRRQSCLAYGRVAGAVEGLWSLMDGDSVWAVAGYSAGFYQRDSKGSYLQYGDPSVQARVLLGPQKSEAIRARKRGSGRKP